MCLSSPGWAPVQLSVCRVQQDSAGVFPVGAEECRCCSPGAMGVWFVCTANQPPAGSAASLCLLLWIQGTITWRCHYHESLLLLLGVKDSHGRNQFNLDVPELQNIITDMSVVVSIKLLDLSAVQLAVVLLFSRACVDTQLASSHFCWRFLFNWNLFDQIIFFCNLFNCCLSLSCDIQWLL